MARYNRWGFESIDLEDAPTVSEQLDVDVPPLENQGQQVTTVPDGSEAKKIAEESEIEHSDETNPKPLHEDVTTDASELFDNDATTKELAAKRTAEQKEEKPYVPPKPKPKTTEDNSDSSDDDDTSDTVSDGADGADDASGNDVGGTGSDELSGSDSEDTDSGTDSDFSDIDSGDNGAGGSSSGDSEGSSDSSDASSDVDSDSSDDSGDQDDSSNGDADSSDSDDDDAVSSDNESNSSDEYDSGVSDDSDSSDNADSGSDDDEDTSEDDDSDSDSSDSDGDDDDESSDDDDSDDDSDSDSDSDEDHGDAEKADVTDEKVESTESDVDDADDKAEKVENTKEELDDDKREVESLKNIAKESLDNGGLSPMAAGLISNRINQISKKWQIRTLSTDFATESLSGDLYATMRLVDKADVALEGLGSRIGDWLSAKLKSMTDFVTSAGNYGKIVAKDSNRKLDKLKSLKRDWESKEIDAPKEYLKCGLDLQLVDIIKSRGIANMNGDMEAICKAALECNISKMPSLINAKPKTITAGEFNRLDIMETTRSTDIDLDKPIKMMELGGGVSLVAAFTESGKTLFMSAVSPKSKGFKLKPISVRDLISATEAYAAGGEYLVKGIGESILTSKVIDQAYKDMGDDKSKLIGYCNAVNVVIMYNRAITCHCRALNAIISEYMKNPNYPTVGTEGFFDNVIRMFHKDVNKVKPTKANLRSAKEALQKTVLNEKWWETVEVTGKDITTASILQQLVVFDYSSNGVATGDSVITYYHDLNEFDRAAASALLAKDKDVRKNAAKFIPMYLEAAKDNNPKAMKEVLERCLAENEDFENPLFKKYKNFPLSGSKLAVVTKDGIGSNSSNVQGTKITALTKEQIVKLGQLICDSGDEYGWSWLDSAAEDIIDPAILDKWYDKLEDVYDKFDNDPIVGDDTHPQNIELYAGFYCLDDYRCIDVGRAVTKVRNSILDLINASIRDV